MIEMAPSGKELAEFVVAPEQWQDALRYYHEHRSELIQAAAWSRRNAVSHRDPPFKVGCAAMGIEPDQAEGEYGVYQAYNFKPAPGETRDEDKRCAERNVLDAARRWAKVIVAIATISREISTGDPTKARRALHPCQDCRNVLRALLQEGFIRADTIICNANDGGPEVLSEERTLQELLELYQDDPQQK
ncbi:MAG: hypothetical protein HY978_01515 [Candidatus Liptonbacteria bacterium]|nr:hypothetical protein [Candidatus Liptonbacteria bacterium]